MRLIGAFFITIRSLLALDDRLRFHHRIRVYLVVNGLDFILQVHDPSGESDHNDAEYEPIECFAVHAERHEGLFVAREPDESRLSPCRGIATGALFA